MANSVIIIDWQLVEDEINKYFESIGWDMRCTMTNQEKKFPEYAEFAFFGRGAGKNPPISAIVGWLDGKRNNGVGFQFRDRRGRFLSAEQMAYPISKKIGREGTKGNPEVWLEVERITTEAIANNIDMDGIANNILRNY